jgi:PPOX class probable F420-dependent enzyme
LLDERRIATLTTYSRDGLPHVTAVWFLHEEGNLYVATGSSTGKARNLTRDPRAALCIESRAAGREAGLSACGTVTLLQGEEAVPIARRVNEKYLTEIALADPVVGPVFETMSDVVVQLTPERWIAWDMGEVGEQLFADREVDEAAFFRPTEI